MRTLQVFERVTIVNIVKLLHTIVYAVDNDGNLVWHLLTLNRDPNSEIILQESLELLKQGVLKPTGRVFVQELPDGSKVELPEPEPIHTYNGWKDLGYQVKKGEHAKATFPVWKWKGQKNEETGEEEGGTCYQRKAFWFTFDQVEKVS